jgi:hypothetical protein
VGDRAERHPPVPVLTHPARIVVAMRFLLLGYNLLVVCAVLALRVLVLSFRPGR